MSPSARESTSRTTGWTPTPTRTSERRPTANSGSPRTTSTPRGAGSTRATTTTSSPSSGVPQAAPMRARTSAAAAKIARNLARPAAPTSAPPRRARPERQGPSPCVPLRPTRAVAATARETIAAPVCLVTPIYAPPRRVRERACCECVELMKHLCLREAPPRAGSNWGDWGGGRGRLVEARWRRHRPCGRCRLEFCVIFQRL